MINSFQRHGGITSVCVSWRVSSAGVESVKMFLVSISAASRGCVDPWQVTFEDVWKTRGSLLHFYQEAAIFDSLVHKHTPEHCKLIIGEFEEMNSINTVVVHLHHSNFCRCCTTRMPYAWCSSWWMFVVESEIQDGVFGGFRSRVESTQGQGERG